MQVLVLSYGGRGHGKSLWHSALTWCHLPLEGRAPIVLQRRNKAQRRAGSGPKFPEPVRDMLRLCEGCFLRPSGRFLLKTIYSRAGFS